MLSRPPGRAAELGGGGGGGGDGGTNGVAPVDTVDEPDGGVVAETAGAAVAAPPAEVPAVPDVAGNTPPPAAVAVCARAAVGLVVADVADGEAAVALTRTVGVVETTAAVGALLLFFGDEHAATKSARARLDRIGIRFIRSPMSRCALQDQRPSHVAGSNGAYPANCRHVGQNGGGRIQMVDGARISGAASCEVIDSSTFAPARKSEAPVFVGASQEIGSE